MAGKKGAALTPEEQAAHDEAVAAARARREAGAPPAEGDDELLAPVAAPASATTAGSYDVLHGMVGEWPQGTEVTAEELAAANVDKAGVQRLLDLGAIAPHTDKE